ncbi:hypothetical protein HYDPIDRAFT_31712 [Hydnomerulius pinastri MD-312]|uniref:F-box domain-containing protein n=1 Tax=Hydnomerulius pinastri MD-312 TaxID=994086 RepID=A0A0C9WBQ3_9AGAM|nr:hypothetical protein HYDPIDRAFT_31712 [Hydnomerulius pinastri MD-312]
MAPSQSTSAATQTAKAEATPVEQTHQVSVAAMVILALSLVLMSVLAIVVALRHRKAMEAKRRKKLQIQEKPPPTRTCWPPLSRSKTKRSAVAKENFTAVGALHATSMLVAAAPSKMFSSPIAMQFRVPHENKTLCGASVDGLRHDDLSCDLVPESAAPDSLSSWDRLHDQPCAQHSTISPQSGPSTSRLQRSASKHQAYHQRSQSHPVPDISVWTPLTHDDQPPKASRKGLRMDDWENRPVLCVKLPVTSGRPPTPPAGHTSTDQAKEGVSSNGLDGYDSPLTDLDGSSTEDDHDSGEFDSDDGVLSDSSVSEYRGRVEKPPRKKLKLAVVGRPTKTSAAKRTTKSKGKKRACISLLLTMPLDIMYEVFTLLEPVDLVRLCRTNKAIRGTLMSRKAISIWKSARQMHNDFPHPSPGLSEPHWAVLLFGGSRCQECNTPNVHRPDLLIRRRVCTSCRKKNLVYSVNFSKIFPDFTPEIMDLIPFTNVGGWAHGHASHSKFFWTSDVYDMGQQLGKYQKDVHMRKTGARVLLNDYKEARKQFVASILEHALVTLKWFEDEDTRRKDKVLAKGEKNKDIIIERLIRLGYDPLDINLLQRHYIHSHDFRPINELTDKRWAQLLPKLTALLIETKAKRLVEQRKAIIAARKAKFIALYEAYVKQMEPTQWAYMPWAVEALQFGEIQALVDDPSLSPISDALWEEAINAMPELVEAWTLQKRKSLMFHLTQSADAPSSSSVSAASTQQPSQPLPESQLDSPASVFFCDNLQCSNATDSVRPPLCGWEEIKSHKCFQSYGLHYPINKVKCGTFKFSKRGREAVEAIMTTLKVGPHTTTSRTLDRDQSRFICMHCSPITDGGEILREALSWRQCIAHFIKKGHANPWWHVLSSAQMELLRQSPGPDPATLQTAWCCKRCAHHFEQPVSKDAALTHLRSAHAVNEPVEDVDYFFSKYIRRSLPSAVVVVASVSTGANASGCKDPKGWRCKHCPNQNRPFELQGVQSHIRAKYGPAL